MCKSNFDCTNNAECLEGQCFCKDGFKAQGSACIDIDECIDRNGNCGDNAVCINSPGGYRCECAAGFIGSPPRVSCRAPCDDVKCGKHSYCKADGAEAYCVCENGWTFDPSDIAAGCVDINECDISSGAVGVCGLNARCINTLGSYDCSCQDGFVGDPKKHCLDIDECLQDNPCGAGAECLNIEGSYTCECPDGTLPDPDPTIRCSTILSCRSDSECPGNARCDNDKRCLCPEPNIGNECRRKYSYLTYKIK